MAELTVTAEDRATLERWTTRRKTAHGLAVRAEIVLRCSSGCSNSQVARELRLTNATVGKWRSRFAAEGVAGLLDEPRSGAPRRITDEHVEAVIVKTLESTPRDATHWSVRSMAAATGMTRQSVHRIWKAFGLQPASERDIQAVHRSAVDREGARHRRPVPEPTRTSAGAVR